MRDDTIELTKAPTNVIPSQGQPVFYVNICAVSITPEEAVLQFGLRTLDNPALANGITTIYMNLSHAKRLAEAPQTIQRYENVFGEIVIDPVTLLPQEMREQLGISEK